LRVERSAVSGHAGSQRAGLADEQGLLPLTLIDQRRAGKHGVDVSGQDERRSRRASP